MSSLRKELATCRCQLADVMEWYKQALEVKNDYKRRFNVVTTELGDLKVTLYDLKKEEDELKKENADLQKAIGEKSKRLEELEAES